MTPIIRVLVVRIEEDAGVILEQGEQLLAQGEQLQLLKDEVARLKGQKPRPKIPPNRLDQGSSNSPGG